MKFCEEKDYYNGKETISFDEYKKLVSCFEYIKNYKDGENNDNRK